MTGNPKQYLEVGHRDVHSPRWCYRFRSDANDLSSSFGFLWGPCCSIFSFMCMYCRSLFVLLSFFFWSLYCLSFDLWILITPMVSSNSSYHSRGRIMAKSFIIYISLFLGKWECLVCPSGLAMYIEWMCLSMHGMFLCQMDRLTRSDVLYRKQKMYPINGKKKHFKLWI